MLSSVAAAAAARGREGEEEKRDRRWRRKRGRRTALPSPSVLYTLRTGVGYTTPLWRAGFPASRYRLFFRFARYSPNAPCAAARFPSPVVQAPILRDSYRMNNNNIVLFQWPSLGGPIRRPLPSPPPCHSQRLANCSSAGQQYFSSCRPFP